MRAVEEKVGDEELMMRFKNGDQTAFDVLFQRYRLVLYRYFLRQCQQPALAEELYQDVWLKLINAKQRYQPKAQFNTYLFTIAHRRWLDYVRRNENKIVFIEDTGEKQEHIDSRPQPDAELDQRQQKQRFLFALKQLPANQREVFILREESGLSLETIAHITQENVETVKSRLRYAVKKLKQVCIQE